IASEADKAIEPFEAGAAPVGEAVGPETAYARELQNWQDADAETAYEPAGAPAPFAADEDNSVSLDAHQHDRAEDTEAAERHEPAAPEIAPEHVEPDRRLFRSLSQLVDRLAADEQLYT